MPELNEHQYYRLRISLKNLFWNNIFAFQNFNREDITEDVERFIDVLTQPIWHPTLTCEDHINAEMVLILACPLPPKTPYIVWEKTNETKIEIKRGQSSLHKDQKDIILKKMNREDKKSV